MPVDIELGELTAGGLVEPKADWTDQFPINPGSIQVGFASLVDLRDGDIEWFNRLVSYKGDLRNAQGTREAIKNLTNGIPL